MKMGDCSISSPTGTVSRARRASRARTPNA
jgi:hypothetical protein